MSSIPEEGQGERWDRVSHGIEYPMETTSPIHLSWGDEFSRRQKWKRDCPWREGKWWVHAAWELEKRVIGVTWLSCQDSVEEGVGWEATREDAPFHWDLHLFLQGSIGSWKSIIHLVLKGSKALSCLWFAEMFLYSRYINPKSIALESWRKWSESVLSSAL